MATLTAKHASAQQPTGWMDSERLQQWGHTEGVERHLLLDERERGCLKERHHVWGYHGHIYSTECPLPCFSKLICDQRFQSMFGTVAAELAKRLLIG